MVDDFLDDLVEVLGATGVEATEEELRAVFFVARAGIGEFVGVNVGGADLRAGLAEGAGDAPAEALGSAGYEGYFAV